MSEKNIQQEIRKAVSQAGGVTFRNNVGQGILGRVLKQEGGTFHIVNGRRVDYGLCVGSSDLIGWRTITITPDMVGKQIARFMALEVKTQTGKATAEQINFIQAVRKAGGISGVVRSTDEAIALLNPLEGL